MPQLTGCGAGAQAPGLHRQTPGLSGARTTSLTLRDWRSRSMVGWTNSAARRGRCQSDHPPQAGRGPAHQRWTPFPREASNRDRFRSLDW